MTAVREKAIMTKQELIEHLESELGLRLEPNPKFRRPSAKTAEFFATSTVNGAHLFTIEIYEDETGWRFGSTANHLADFWTKFCRLGKK